MEWLEQLLKWFNANGRRYFWRFERSWYVTIVAEIMLIRTRASVVEKVLREFLNTFPTPEHLCRANVGEIEVFFERIGLVKRSRWVREVVCKILEEWNGEVPCDEEILRELPGIGRYLRNVLLTKLCSAPRPFVDTNVLRVVGRFLGRNVDVDFVEKWLSENVPRDKLYLANLALMDVGALVCLPRKPRCSSCPLSRWCSHHASKR